MSPSPTTARRVWRDSDSIPRGFNDPRQTHDLAARWPVATGRRSYSRKALISRREMAAAMAMGRNRRKAT